MNLYGQDLPHAEPEPEPVEDKPRARKHGLIGKTVQEAIKCIEWGNGGYCRVRDWRSSRRIDDAKRAVVADFTITIFVRDGIVVRVGN